MIFIIHSVRIPAPSSSKVLCFGISTAEPAATNLVKPNLAISAAFASASAFEPLAEVDLLFEKSCITNRWKETRGTQRFAIKNSGVQTDEISWTITFEKLRKR